MTLNLTSLSVMVLLAPILTLGSVTAQEIGVDGEDQSCSGCLTVSRVAVLGNVEDEISVAGPARVVSRGSRFFVIEQFKPNVLVYDSTGGFERDVGRQGQGPGELRGAMYIGPGRGDSVLVGEVGNRIHLFSGSGDFGRTVTVRNAGRRGFQFPNGDLLVSGSGSAGRGSDSGDPVRLFSSEGSRESRLGTGFDTRNPSPTPAQIAPASDTTFWMAWPDNYRVEERTKTDNPLRIVTRSVDWFPPYDAETYQSDASESPPSPAIVGIQYDSDYLWVAISVADEDWRPSDRGAMSWNRINEQWDTVIEVLNLETGSLVDNIRMDGFVRGFSGDRQVYTLREDDLGMLYVDVWSLEIRVDGGG
jgi:hypothetical protein